MEASEQIISIKEARKLLGKKANGMSDVEIADLITQLDFIATQAIRDFQRQKNGGSKNSDGLLHRSELRATI